MIRLIVMCALIQPLFSQTSGTTVDLEKYSGAWYIIACIPTRFDKNWENVKESYTVSGKNKIAIYTTYTKKNDPKERNVRSKGFVRSENNALWRVQFVWPFRADYLIEEIGEAYSYAVAGGRKHTYFYILCRNPQINDSIYTDIVSRYSKKGYDMKKLRKIDQS